VYSDPDGVTPAISNGAMYFTVHGKVRAIRLATGRSLWIYTPRVGTDGQYHLAGSDVAVSNGTVYAAGSSSDAVYALNAATGRERWSFRAGLRHGDLSDAAIAYGHVFVGEAAVPPDDGPQTTRGLYCLSGRTGRVLWRFRDSSGFGAGPSVANGVVYAADDFSGRVVALRASNGHLLWSARVSRSGVAGNTIVTDGMVLVEYGGRGAFAYVTPTQ
jgi:outer membrane protein assembly factor BamB